ncbi:cytosolic carboxypeptidase 4-like isoform X2 [Daphnia pulex]|uniref:cytosolic carboxypeptidase 4-like isoform X2 n=1 Tax=Daphnia pulex TaxID=6669 RepID=UPI001EDE3AD6|nr:cytosolic carboxypeptidase 4-like isoform X2 [Daphnia pulex]
MVEEEVEQEILGEWNSIAEDSEAIAALTRRTRNLLRGFKDAKHLQRFLEKLYSSVAFSKLVNLLKITRNNQTRGDILYIAQSIFEAQSANKKETNTLTVCQTVEANRLVLDVLKLLESKEGNRKLTLKQHKCAASILSSLARHKEGRQVIIEAKVVERLHAFLLALPNEKARDTLIHKIGQTILRCVPLHDLPVTNGTHSAFRYLPFESISSGSLGNGATSDSSEESEEEEEIGDGSLPGSRNWSFCSGTKKKSKKFSPPTNPYRSAEELEQYRRHFDLKSDQYEEDELRNISKIVPPNLNRQQIYEFFARRTKSIHGFRLIPCPDWSNSSGSSGREPFYIKDRNVCRSKLFKSLNMVLNPNSYRPEVVYDLDSLLLDAEQTQSIRMEDFEAASKHRISQPNAPLEFESRFESGNLRRAIRIGSHEYDLILNADVNSFGRQQWFYFRISGEGVCSSKSYTFNVINLEKQRTLFHQGMQPLMFSVKRYMVTRTQPVWERSGTSMCYYRNGFRQSNAEQTSYWSLSFTVTVPYDNDVLYIAYHYPYTYSQLMTDVVTWLRTPFPIGYPSYSMDRLRISTLCRSPCGNPVPLLLIDYDGDAKSCCVFMSRVHPCESNSSWSMRGLVVTALQDMTQSDERHHPLFILPMLNVDGTVHGCSRTELSNEDLNRRWLTPNLHHHPTIYHAKGLLEFICRILDAKPAVLCDMHGHSRRFNAFVYGCKGSQSWCPDDWSQKDAQGDHPTMKKLKDENGDDDDTTSLPFFVQLMQAQSPLFDTNQCCFEVEKNRETTARIVGWRHLGIKNIYTLECSLAGSNQLPLQGLQHFNTASYFQVGKALMKVTRRMC